MPESGEKWNISGTCTLLEHIFCLVSTLRCNRRYLENNSIAVTNSYQEKLYSVS